MKPLVSLANDFTTECLISAISSLVRKARFGRILNSAQRVRRVQKKAESIWSGLKCAGPGDNTVKRS
jgi:hypothetical protein